MKAPPSDVTSLRSTLVLEGEITTRASLSQALATIFLPSSRNQKSKMIHSLAKLMRPKAVTQELLLKMSTQPRLMTQMSSR